MGRAFPTFWLRNQLGIGLGYASSHRFTPEQLGQKALQRQSLRGASGSTNETEINVITLFLLKIESYIPTSPEKGHRIKKFTWETKSNKIRINRPLDTRLKCLAVEPAEEM